MRLNGRLEALLADPPDWLDGPGRARIEGARHSLGWRIDLIAAWEALLQRLGGPADPEFVDWLAVDRVEGREFDIGLHRHWLDPARPLAKTVLEPAHGVLVTSATLRAGGDWDVAEARSGSTHLLRPAQRFEAKSPFDYPNQAEVLIVTDVKRGDLPQLANAYARLIAAAGGGTLGLFTAIRRLRAVHARIADRLARDGLPLLCPACRPDRHRHAGRHLPRRSPRQPARHRCAARRGGRARRFAAAGGDGGRALAQADRAARRAAAGRRRSGL
jgi:ATP-dependent DNA helicase DinG